VRALAILGENSPSFLIVNIPYSLKQSGLMHRVVALDALYTILLALHVAFR
jgi:hypothetical protein